MDIKSASAAAIVTEGEAALAAVYANWLSAHVAEGRINLAGLGVDANSVATTILGAFYGLKKPLPDYDQFCIARDQLARMLARGLAA